MAKTKLENKNPPRRVEIRGQDHLLAYITPAEAQLLMDNGGSGEPGPMGIPSYPEPSMGGSKDQRSGSGNERSEDRDAAQAGRDRAADRQAERDESDREDQRYLEEAKQRIENMPGGLSPGQSMAMAGNVGLAGMNANANQIDDALDALGRGRGRDFFSALQNIQDRRGRARSLGSPIEVNLFGKTFGIPSTAGMLGGLLSNQYLDRLQNALLSPDVSDFTLDETGKLTEVFHGDPLGMGFTVRTGDDLTSKFDDGKGSDTVPPVYNPTTGESQCPDGYVFDADLQACRLDTTLQNVGDTVGGDGFTYEPGTYARMGLLDVAPEDLGGFASTYGTGFGTAPDYEAANLAYRKPVGTMSGIFQDPYNLEGMTLLA